MKIGKWSTTAASNNATPPDGWPEGQAPSTVNDCARELMAAVRTYAQDAEWFDHDFTPTFAAANSFTVPGDQTARLIAGRKLKLFDATTIYRSIDAAVFGGVNTTVSLGAGTAITASLSSFAVAALSPTNQSLPDRISVSAIEVTGTLSLSAMTVAGTLTASGAVSMLTTLSVSGATALKSTLTVGGAVNFGTTLTVSGAVALNSTLTASGAVSMLTTLSVSGAVALNSTLTVSGATMLVGAVAMGSTLTVSGATALGSTLTVSGTVAMLGNANVAGKISASACVVTGVLSADNAAKAWVVFSGVGVVTIQKAFNVTSITDNGVGTYTVNITTSLSSSAMAVSTFAENDSVTHMLPTHGSNQAKTAASYLLQIIALPGAATATDAPSVSVFFYTA